MEPQMQNNNSKSHTILAIVLIVLAGAGFYLLYQNRKENEWKKYPIDTTPGFPYGGGGEMGTEMENKIKTLFDTWMKEQGGFSEYQVNYVHTVKAKSEAMTDEEKSWFPANTSPDALIVVVNYSVNPTNPTEPSDWDAGSGHPEPDGWVREKIQHFIVDKENGNYFITAVGIPGT